MKPSEIVGWMDFVDAYKEAVKHFPPGSLFVEVGAYLGLSTATLATEIKESGKTIRFVSVDTCRGSGIENDEDNHGQAVKRGGGTFAGELHRNLIECGVADFVSLLITDSLTAASLFPDQSIDFLFLDARHDYASVKADILAWKNKIKPDGWMGGDDYTKVWPGVIQAVDELLPDATPWSHDSWKWIKK